MCLSPRLIRNRSPLHLEGSRESLLVSCGKCPECIQQKKNSILQRCVLEYQYISNYTKGFAVFLTLTYDDEHLAPDKSFHYEDMTLFLKRVRKDLGNYFVTRHLGYIPFKYFYVSEYGETSFRPHFHIIFFFHYSLSLPLLYDILSRQWSKGFIDTYYWFRQHVLENNALIWYCSKYLFKQFGVQNNDLVPTDYRCSENLGFYPDFYDYNDSVRLMSAHGVQVDRLHNYFTNKYNFSIRRDICGNDMFSPCGQKMKVRNLDGVNWLLERLPKFFDDFCQKTFNKYQVLDSSKKFEFDNYLNGRTFRSFCEYVYFFKDRIVSCPFIDLSNPFEFYKQCLLDNLNNVKSNCSTRIKITEAYDVKFKDFDSANSLLYNVEYNQSVQKRKVADIQSVNRLIKFYRNV